MSYKTQPLRHILLALAISLAITACGSGDINGPVATPDTTPDTPPDTDTTPDTPPDTDTTPDNPPDTPPATGGAGSNGDYTLLIGTGSVVVVEGGPAVSVPVEIVRNDGHDDTVTLAAEGQTPEDIRQLFWQFEDASISADESSTDLILQLDLSRQPILPENRVLRIIAADANLTPIVVNLTLAIQPTSAPDIYLLAGQSNMVGFSEANARLDGPGEPDEPFERIQQLNVTGNDQENFGSEPNFTDPASQAAFEPRYVAALDPLHDGFDTNIQSKEGTFIGPGLSFAKRALEETTAEIFLVPAAWSDTGFCRRGTNAFPTLGWLTFNVGDDSFSGSLLHDRAITRTNLAIEETGGILRGILWHQGEADSDDGLCAAAYEQNIRDLVNSLRSNIIVDARGPIARGPDSDVPFVVGTMSKGSDERGDQLPFNDFKTIVDGVHRNIANVVPNADFVNNDDLVPPAFPCGEGSCIHFGAAAYREMGARYYDRLRALQQ